MSEPLEGMTEALESIASALRWLGTADAATSMGAIELHAASVKEAAGLIADALRDVASAIREAGPREDVVAQGQQVEVGAALADARARVRPIGADSA